MPNVDEILQGARDAITVGAGLRRPDRTRRRDVVPAAVVGGGGGGGGDDERTAAPASASGSAGRRVGDSRQRGDLEAGRRRHRIALYALLRALGGVVLRRVARSDVELDRDERDVERLTAAEDRDVDRRPISSPTIRRWRSFTPSTGEPSTSTIRSSGRSPAASAGLPSTISTISTADLRPSCWPSRGGSGREPPRDAEVGTPEAPLAHQRADDLARRGVDRHREAEPDSGDGGVDPDHAAAAVDERSARVAGIERCVGLDHVVDDPGGSPGADGQRAAERGDDAGRDGAGEAVGVADRDHELPDAEALGVAELGGLGVAVEAEDGEVGERVGADDVELRARGRRRTMRSRAVGPLDDVGRGEHEAVRRDDDGAAGPVEPAAAANAARDAEVGDRGREPLRDRRDDAGVGVERLVVGRERRGRGRLVGVRVARRERAGDLPSGQGSPRRERLRRGRGAGSLYAPPTRGREPTANANGEQRADG